MLHGKSCVVGITSAGWIDISEICENIFDYHGNSIIIYANFRFRFCNQVVTCDMITKLLCINHGRPSLRISRWFVHLGFGTNFTIWVLRNMGQHVLATLSLCFQCCDSPISLSDDVQIFPFNNILNLIFVRLDLPVSR